MDFVLVFQLVLHEASFFIFHDSTFASWLDAHGDQLSLDVMLISLLVLCGSRSQCSAPLSILHVPKHLIVDINVRAIPSNFAVRIFSESALRVQPEPVLLDGSIVPRIVGQTVNVMQMVVVKTLLPSSLSKCNQLCDSK